MTPELPITDLDLGRTRSDTNRPGGDAAHRCSPRSPGLIRAPKCVLKQTAVIAHAARLQWPIGKRVAGRETRNTVRRGALMRRPEGRKPAP